MESYLWLPALSALLYALGAVAFKRALMHGVGSWRTAFVTNWGFAIFSTLLVFTSHGDWPLVPVLVSALAGVLYLFGSLLTFLALQRGDVSLATPVLGLKVIFVVLFAGFFGMSLTAWDGLAAVLTLFALVLLSLELGSKKNVLQTIGYGASAAAVYALCDVMLARAAQDMHPARTLFVMTWVCAICSLWLMRRFNGPLFHLRGVALWWLLGGGVLIAIQTAILGGTIAFSGDPSGCNVVYSTRGLWSVIFAAIIARHVGLAEVNVPFKVMILRGVGAALLLAAIVLTTFR